MDYIGKGNMETTYSLVIIPMKTQFQHPPLFGSFGPPWWRPLKTELEEDLRPPLLDSRLHSPAMDCELYGDQWLIGNSVSKFDIHRFHVSTDTSIILSLGGTIEYTTICLYIYIYYTYIHIYTSFDHSNT